MPISKIARIFLVLIFPASGAMAQITIDDFTVAQTLDGTVTDMSILGGERDLDEISGGDGTIGGGIFRCEGNFLQACQIIYDGVDGLSEVDQQPGFAPVDFTNGGSQTTFEFPYTLDAGSINLSLVFCDNIPNCSSSANLVNSVGSTTVSFDHSSFAGVDFTNITFLSINQAIQTNGSDGFLGLIADAR